MQCYYSAVISNTYKAYITLRNRELPRLRDIKEETIRERGKERIITPIRIDERVVQKVLCDYCLTPVIEKKLIYDNGASMRGKGVLFARTRLLKHLRSAIAEYGTDFYVLAFDFKSYFDSIPHKTCRYVLGKYFESEIVDITMQIIKQYHLAKIKKIKDKQERLSMLAKLDNDELRGICLGSQVSQTMALLVPNDLDHYIKDICGVKGYVRYMDDGVVFGKTKEGLTELLGGMKIVCSKLGLQFSEKKTRIAHVNEGFTFLKVRYLVLPSGKVVRKLSRKGVVRMRRRLKKLKRMVDNGILATSDAFASYQSWDAHSRCADSFRTRNEMRTLYNTLFFKE